MNKGGSNKEKLGEYIDTLKSQISKVTATVLLALTFLLGNPEAAQGQTYTDRGIISERTKNDVKNLILDTFIKNDSTTKAQFLKIRQNISIIDVRTIDDLLDDIYLKGTKQTLIEARIITFYVLDPNCKYSNIGGYSKKQVEKSDDDYIDRTYINKIAGQAKLIAAISKLKDE